VAVKQEILLDKRLPAGLKQQM